MYLTGSRQTSRLLLNVLFFLSFCWLIASVFLQAGDIEAQDDLALALSRGLELDTQRSSRDSIQCSSGYSTQTNTPCCSEDTIPSQGSTLTSSLLLFNLLASYHTSRGWVHTLLISLFVSFQYQTTTTSQWLETQSLSSSSLTLISPPPSPETVISLSPTDVCSRPNAQPPQRGYPAVRYLILARGSTTRGLIPPHQSTQALMHLLLLHSTLLRLQVTILATFLMLVIKYRDHQFPKCLSSHFYRPRSSYCDPWSCHDPPHAFI